MSDAQERGIQIFADLQRAIETSTEALKNLSAEQTKQAKATSEAAQMTKEAVLGLTEGRLRVMIWSGLTALAIALSAGVILFWVGRHDGFASGEAAGYKAAIAANAGASWANSPSGKAGYALDEMGWLQKIARCDVQGFSKARAANGSTWCVTPSRDGHDYGWPISR